MKAIHDIPGGFALVKRAGKNKITPKQKILFRFTCR
jgi:hypothetical protein